MINYYSMEGGNYNIPKLEVSKTRDFSDQVRNRKKNRKKNEQDQKDKLIQLLLNDSNQTDNFIKYRNIASEESCLKKFRTIREKNIDKNDRKENALKRMNYLLNAHNQLKKYMENNINKNLNVISDFSGNAKNKTNKKKRKEAGIPSMMKTINDQEFQENDTNIDEEKANTRNGQNVEIKFVFNNHEKDSENPLEESLLGHGTYVEKKCCKNICLAFKKHPLICIFVTIIIVIAFIYFISKFDYLIIEFIDKCNNIFFRIGKDKKA